ncbi:MAG TPA: hypothetical protein VMF51_22725 [Nocardioides sp.]|uniref:DUF7657 domain-containing protein n=1 Tax=Nocardioides sp. TaxID=35761 RepID=UPI002C88D3D4|nr:hypothetical protein [Nocardioides sp.]HTW17958.1 hypothetical protein [Nocardioides sp.]
MTAARRRAAALLARPVLVLGLGLGALLLLFVGLNVNGSSLALLAEDPDDAGTIAGTPRVVRSDEFQLRTPMAISAARQDFPDRSWMGLTYVDNAAASHAGPTRTWASVLTPQNWGYLALGPSRGLAWSWWWSFLVCLLGCFALVLRLTSSPGLSLGIATALTFTPYAGWWTSPTPAICLGYAAVAVTLVVAAWTCEHRWRRLLLAFLGGLAGAAFALLLYPPWQVSLGILLLGLGAGMWRDLRVPLRRVAVTLAVALGTTGVLVGAWLLQHRDAISATQGTNYPGQRVATAGEATWWHLMDAPLNFWLAGDAGRTLGTSGPPSPIDNLSEVSSSWLPLPVLALALGLVAWRVLRRTPETAGDAEPASTDVPSWPATGLGLGAAMLLLLAWALLPLPGVVGRVTMLQSVQPTRVPLALGAGLLLLLASQIGLLRRLPRAGWVLAGVAVLVSAIAIVPIVDRLSWDDAEVPVLLAVLSGLVLAACLVGLLAGRRTALVAAAGLAVYSLISWGLVNPLQHAAAPLEWSPVAHQLNRHADPDTNPRVAVFSDFRVVALVRAAGFQSVSGTTPYPSEEVMTELAPTQRANWNNYAQYRWIPAPSGADPVIRPVRGTYMELVIDPCDDRLASLVDPGWVVSDVPLRGDCLERVSRFRYKELQLRLYRVV